MRLADYIGIRKNYEGNTVFFVDSYTLERQSEIPISEAESTQDALKISIEDLTKLRKQIDTVIEDHRKTLPNNITTHSAGDAFSKMHDAMKMETE